MKPLLRIITMLQHVRKYGQAPGEVLKPLFRAVTRAPWSDHLVLVAVKTSFPYTAFTLQRKRVHLGGKAGLIRFARGLLFFSTGLDTARLLPLAVFQTDVNH